MQLLFWGLLLYIGYRIFLSLKKTKNHQATPFRNQGDATIIHKDPVCGIYISEVEAVVGTQNGQRIYFCSHACLNKFRENTDHTKN